MHIFGTKFLAPKITKLKRNLRKLRDSLLYEKGARKMLVKLTPADRFKNFFYAL